MNRTTAFGGDPHIGIFCRVLEEIAVVPPEAPDEFCEALRAVLGITVRLERNGYNLIFENYDSYGTSTLTKKQVAKAISGYYAGTLPPAGVRSMFLAWRPA